MRTRKNYVPTYPGILEFDPSITVPDDSLSVREILDRFAHGQPIDEVKRQVYYGNQSDGDDSIPYNQRYGTDLTDLDKTREDVELRSRFLKEDYDVFLKEKQKEREKQKENESPDKDS